MTTDALIARLAAEAGPPGPPPYTRALGALAAGLVPSLLLYALVLGPRAGLLDLAVTAPRVDFKLLAAASAAISAFALLTPLLRPTGAAGRRRLALAALAALVAIGIGAEMLAVPRARWIEQLVGHNALFCMVMLPLLALGPFAALFVAARHAAPAYPSRAGAAIGFLSGALAAVVYATHCPDDSPFFVATWYTLAIAALTTLGAGLGRTWLRW